MLGKILSIEEKNKLIDKANEYIPQRVMYLSKQLKLPVTKRIALSKYSLYVTEPLKIAKEVNIILKAKKATTEVVVANITV